MAEGSELLTVGLPALVILVILMATGMWIGTAMLLVGLVVIVFIAHGSPLLIGLVPYNLMNSFVLCAIPLFIFMSAIIMASGMSEPIYKSISGIFGWIPGSLLHANILTCAVFSALTGTATATAATIGNLAIPEQMDRRGYDKRMVLGTIAAGGQLGPIIPPSFVMIILGAWLGESVGRLFMAGVFPGLILAGLYMVYILIRCKMQPQLVGGKEKFNLKNALDGLKEAWAVFLIIFAVLFTIYLGIATATEAAALGAVAAVLVAGIKRRLTLRVIKNALFLAVAIQGMFTLLLVGAALLAYGFGLLKIPEQFGTLVLGSGLGHYGVVIVLTIMYVILGCFLEPICMILVTLPFVTPIMLGLGYDLIFISVFMLIATCLGNLTPPVGLLLFIVQAISGPERSTVEDVIIGTIPYWFAFLITIALLVMFPQIALWLPARMMG